MIFRKKKNKHYVNKFHSNNNDYGIECTEDIIGTLGELLDDTEHKDLPEYARASIEKVYNYLCLNTFKTSQSNLSEVN